MNTSTFSTERLQLAIYLHAVGRLTFLRCEPVGLNGKLRFVFDDPERIGTQLEFEYERGASVQATALFASQKYLRRKMSEQENRRTGETRQHALA